MYVHGFGPNTALADPISIFAAAYVRDNFAYYGYSASALQYRQDVKDFQLPICNTPEEEVARTHYRAIQDMKKAMNLLYNDPESYGINTSYFSF